MIDIFVDTNLFVYSVEANAAFHKQSTKILSDTRYNLFTSSKCLNEFVAVCTKLNIGYFKILNYLKEIEKNVIILFPNADSFAIFKTLNRKL